MGSNNSNSSAAHVFETFYISGLHKTNPFKTCPNTTYCIIQASLTDNQPNERMIKMFRNSSEKHAEIFAVECIIDNLSIINTSKDTEFYLSYSPCEDCADKIIKFVDEQNRKKNNLTMKIVFAQLYIVNRHSCSVRLCCQDDITSGHGRKRALEKPENERGLKGLHQNERITIVAFSPQSWRTLVELLLEMPFENNDVDGKLLRTMRSAGEMNGKDMFNHLQLRSLIERVRYMCVMEFYTADVTKEMFTYVDRDVVVVPEEAVDGITRRLKNMSINETHAMNKALESLTHKNIYTARPVMICMNYSPCTTCLEEWKKYLECGVVSFHLVIAEYFNNRSCSGLPVTTDSVTTESFTPQLWGDFVEGHAPNCSRNTEDAEVGADLTHIIGSN